LRAGGAYNYTIDLRDGMLPARGEVGMLRFGRPIRRALAAPAPPPAHGAFPVAVERT